MEKSIMEKRYEEYRRSDDLIRAINKYMNWYRTSRIKSTLGGLSPLEYRRRIGVGV